MGNAAVCARSGSGASPTASKVAITAWRVVRIRELPAVTGGFKTAHAERRGNEPTRCV
jgi:hypothetical protein